MPQVRVQVSHSLDRHIAVKRLRGYSQQLQKDHGHQISQLEETWNDEGVGEFSFRVLGFKITGTTTIHAVHAEVEVQLPFAAIPLRGLIEKEIANRLEAALAHES